MISKCRVITLHNGHIDDSLVSPDKLQHAICECCILALDISNDVNQGLADLDYLVHQPPECKVKDCLDNILIDWSKAINFSLGCITAAKFHQGCFMIPYAESLENQCVKA